MKYLSFAIDVVTGFGLWAAAINYFEKDLRTFWLIFMLLGLERFDVANLYLKINNGGNRNENKNS